MNIYSLAEKTITESGGIARNVDFRKNGLSNSQITYLCNRGYLDRIRRGYYQLGSYQDSSDERIIATLFQMGFSAWIPRYSIMVIAIVHRWVDNCIPTDHYKNPLMRELSKNKTILYLSRSLSSR